MNINNKGIVNIGGNMNIINSEVGEPVYEIDGRLYTYDDDTCEYVDVKTGERR